MMFWTNCYCENVYLKLWIITKSFEVWIFLRVYSSMLLIDLKSVLLGNLYKYLINKFLYEFNVIFFHFVKLNLDRKVPVKDEPRIWSWGYRQVKYICIIKNHFRKIVLILIYHTLFSSSNFALMLNNLISKFNLRSSFLFGFIIELNCFFKPKMLNLI